LSHNPALATELDSVGGFDGSIDSADNTDVFRFDVGLDSRERADGHVVVANFEEEIPTPKAGEVRVKVLAAGVSLPDVLAREGVHPETPRLPYTPGWDLVGTLINSAKAWLASNCSRQSRPCPSTGATRSTCACPTQACPVPAGLDAADAVAVVLNYITAYQMLHRTAKARPGQRIGKAMNLLHEVRVLVVDGDTA